MRTKCKPLSLWEQHQIDQFVNAVLEKMDLSQTDEELRQCAWAAFLSVFREDPRAFSFPHSCGWARAYARIQQEVNAACRTRGASRWKEISLERPVSAEVPLPLAQLLQQPHGDFQASVCFHEFLYHLEPDARHLAYGIIHGGTLEEMRRSRLWSCEHAGRIYEHLRQGMEEYVKS